MTNIFVNNQSNLELSSYAFELLGRLKMTKSFDITQVIQDAYDFDFWRATLTDARASIRVDEFLDLLGTEQIDFVLVGDIAVLAYVDGRNTKDIDLIVALTELEKLAELEITYQDRDFARAIFRGLQLDILKTENRLFDLVRREYSIENRFQNHLLRIATPEGLLLLKLFALPSLYRQGIFDRVALYETDITMLLQRYPIQPANLVSTLQPYLSETDLASLQDILKDIEKRIRRFRERPSGYDTN